MGRENDLEKIRVFLIDDHCIFREGLAALLKGQPDIEVCGQASDGPGALALLKKTQADVVLLDLLLGGSSGFDLISDIRTLSGNAPILILSMRGETEVVRRALKSGAAGYIRKQDAPDQLITGIHRVFAGEVFVPGPLARLLMEISEDVGRSPVDVRLVPLTRRERQVLRLLAEGKGISEIAKTLEMSPRTVDTHQANLKRKLKLSSARELVIHASELLKKEMI